MKNCFRTGASLDDQQRNSTLVIKKLSATARNKWIQPLVVSLNTETTHPGCFAPNINILTIQKIIKSQGIPIHVIHLNKLLAVRQAFL